MKGSNYRTTSFVTIGFVFVLALIVSTIGCNSGQDSSKQEKTTIYIGFTPAENADNVETRGEALAQELEKHTGLKIKVYVANSYAAVVEALAHHQIDFAWLPPFSLVQAEKLCKAKPLLKVVRFGSDRYFGGIIVRKDSPYKSIEDLRGKTIAWADVSSTSGHIFPKAALIKKGIKPDEFFSREIFAGGHDKVVLAVLSGQVDAGGTWVNDQTGKTGSWNKYFKDRADQIRTLMVTRPIPNDTFATTSEFQKKHPKIVKKLVRALQEIVKDKKERDLLKSLYGIEGLVPAKESDFDVVRDAAKLTDLWKE